MDRQLIIFIAIAITCHLYAMKFVWLKGTKHYDDKLIHVYDIIHSNFKDYTKYNYTKNWYLLVFIIPIILNLSKLNNSIINEYLLGYCLIIFIRSLMIICTILPRQNNCKVTKLKIFNKTIGGTCYDKMFSGHFAFGLFTTLFMFKNSIIDSSFSNKILFILFNALHFFIIGITRSHYTIDIVVSVFITLFVFMLVKDEYIKSDNLFAFVDKI
jgi:hypothetical protein